MSIFQPNQSADVIMCCGFPGSTKSTYVKSKYPQATIISNDLSKTALIDFEKAIREQKENLIIIDNTNLTKKSRKEYLDISKKYNKVVDVLFFNTNIEQCQIRVLHRQWQKFGRLFMTGDGVKDPHVFPPAVLFAARKNLEVPKKEEGVQTIRTPVGVSDATNLFLTYPNKAVFFDIDGTLRQTENLPNKYPTHPEEVVPYTDINKMKEKINSYREKGYLFFGLSNQSGISKKILTEEECKACMDRTKEILDFNDIEIIWCSHQSVPIRCYCRKPQSGMGMYFIEKYQVNPTNSIMVGDMTTDKTFAERLGMTYIDVKKFY